MDSLYAQHERASVTEMVQNMKTYPFSDPDPVANPSDIFYPYFRFDGFSEKSIDKEWKVVLLENDYICLTLFPEIGGKIWGAFDKVSKKEFIYNNHVVNSVILQCEGLGRLVALNLILVLSDMLRQQVLQLII